MSAQTECDCCNCRDRRCVPPRRFINGKYVIDEDSDSYSDSSSSGDDESSVENIPLPFPQPVFSHCRCVYPRGCGMLLYLGGRRFESDSSSSDESSDSDTESQDGNTGNVGNEQIQRNQAEIVGGSAPEVPDNVEGYQSDSDSHSGINTGYHIKAEE